MPPSLLISNAAICHCLEGYSRDSGSDRNTVRDSGNVNGIRDLTAIKEAGFAAIYQGLEGYSRDPGSDRNTVRDSVNVNGIRDLTATKEAGFAAVYQGREGFSQDPGFDRNTVRDSDFCLKPRMLSSAFQGSIPPR